MLFMSLVFWVIVVYRCFVSGACWLSLFIGVLVSGDLGLSLFMMTGSRFDCMCCFQVRRCQRSVSHKNSGTYEMSEFETRVVPNGRPYL